MVLQETLHRMQVTAGSRQLVEIRCDCGTTRIMHPWHFGDWFQSHLEQTTTPKETQS
jgi:hypothetical protein